MRIALFSFVLVACGGGVEAVSDDAGAAREASAEASADVAPIEASADAPSDAPEACPVLTKPCPLGREWCSADRTSKWVCVTGVWELQPCSKGQTLCSNEDGSFRCEGPVCQ